MSLLRQELSEYSPASNLTLNDSIRERRRRGESLVNLAFGQSPFPIPDFAVESLRRHADNALYLPADGIRELREAVAAFHRHFDDFRHFDADSVVCGPGSKELIFLILTVFDGVVFVASPSWTTYKPQTLLAGRRCVQLPLTAGAGWKIDADTLRRATADCSDARNKLLIINTPDNPTGQAYTEQELKQLAEFLRSESFTVVSDEIYARLRFDGRHSSLAHAYPEGTIVTSGVSKWAGAGGWRLGYAMFPKQLRAVRAAVASAATHSYSCVAAPVQHAVVELLGNLPAAEELLFHSRRVLRAVARHCEQQLRDAGATVLPAEAGFYLLPDFSAAGPGLARLGIRTGAEMCDRILSDTGVALMSAGPAFLRPVEELTLRLCFVDFDGAAALAASRQLGDKPLPEDFVRAHCEPTHSGVVRLADWLRDTSRPAAD